MFVIIYSLWVEELKDAQRKNRRPRLRNAFIKFLGFRYFILGVLSLVEVILYLINNKIINCSSHTLCLIKFDIHHPLIDHFVYFEQEGVKVGGPLLVGRLISFFAPGPGLSKTDAYITAAALSFVVLIEAAVHAPHFVLNNRHGIHLRIAAGSLIYRKVSNVEFVPCATLYVLFVPSPIQNVE